MDFSKFDYISFDCYGTLIDWETGILRAVRTAFPSLQRSDTDILSAYSEIEPALQIGPYRKYREILRGVILEMAREFGETAADPDAISESLVYWQPFPDTVPALQNLSNRFKLVVISNIDNDLFSATRRWLDVPFTHVITAEQVGSYKPNPRNFEVALQRIGCGSDKILHVAESLFHDIAPARNLGIASVWVNRRAGKLASASKESPVTPDLVVRNLAELAQLSAQ